MLENGGPWLESCGMPDLTNITQDATYHSTNRMCDLIETKKRGIGRMKENCEIKLNSHPGSLLKNLVIVSCHYPKKMDEILNEQYNTVLLLKRV